MDTPYRVVRLQRNHLYPTYQLFAHMASKKTTPQDGLRLAALTTMEWLRLRLGDTVPKELLLPGPEEFRSCSEEALQSLHLNAGFVIDIVSLPEQGAWSLQITEPDLGSDPGNPKQARQAVPGRIIETNIGFRIVGHQLQCGFQGCFRCCRGQCVGRSLSSGCREAAGEQPRLWPAATDPFIAKGDGNLDRGTAETIGFRTPLRRKSTAHRRVYARSETTGDFFVRNRCLFL